MAAKLTQTEELKKFLNVVSGMTSERGNPRTKKIVHRILTDLFNTIEDLDVRPSEFWAAVDYFNDLGQHLEAGLLTAGLGLEHFLDLRMDAEDMAAGVKHGTPRTIEGPLYVANAPLSKGSARLDDGTDKGEVLFMRGVVRDLDGKPVANAIVDVWHANTKGTYSFFDKSQSKYNLRRRIQTGSDGRYEFRTIVPAGYGCPPDGPTQRLVNELGRHGQRPAHIHFFVSAPGYRHLTTQINIAGDKYLYDDFAFATREGLIPKIVRHQDAKTMKDRAPAAVPAGSTHGAPRFSSIFGTGRHIPGPYTIPNVSAELNTPFSEIEFNFTLTGITTKDAEDAVHRRRVEAA
jgi:catechol 1,2-dioxygenase